MPTSDPNHRGFAGQPDWSAASLLNASVAELNRWAESVADTDPMLAIWLKDMTLALPGRKLAIAEMIRERVAGHHHRS